MPRVTSRCDAEPAVFDVLLIVDNIAVENLQQILAGADEQTGSDLDHGLGFLPVQALDL